MVGCFECLREGVLKELFFEPFTSVQSINVEVSDMRRASFQVVGFPRYWSGRISSDGDGGLFPVFRGRFGIDSGRGTGRRDVFDARAFILLPPTHQPTEVQPALHILLSNTRNHALQILPWVLVVHADEADGFAFVFKDGHVGSVVFRNREQVCRPETEAEEGFKVVSVDAMSNRLAFGLGHGRMGTYNSTMPSRGSAAAPKPVNIEIELHQISFFGSHPRE